MCRREPSTFDNPLMEFAQMNTDLDRAVDLAMGTSHLSSRIYLKFACEKLPNMDYFSLTDAFLVLYERGKNNNWVEVGRTEIVEDSLNPKFIKAIEVVYYFEEDQQFKIAAYDADEFGNPDLDVNKANFIGEADFSIQKLITQRNKPSEKGFTVPFYGAEKILDSPRGTVTITYEEGKSTHNQVLEFGLKAENSDFSFNTGYFYIIAKKDKEVLRKYDPILRSEIINYTDRENTWKRVSVPLSSLVTGKDDKSEINDIKFQFQLYRHSKNGNHRLLATYDTTVMNFIEFDEVITLRGHRDDEYFISKSKASLITIPSFLDYINAGLDMNLVVGVDFTGSNGNPNYPNSLHYIHGDSNQYLSAIYEVSKILLNFDTDQQVPLFGFGAALPKFSDQVSHCFAMNGNVFRPEVAGIDGVMRCYQD